MKKKRPESQMMSYGFDSKESKGAIKPPIFQTSTFGFKTAEQGKAYFELENGVRERGENEEEPLIYSRLSNPNLETFEKRLCLWDEAEEGAAFESGMGAISTTLLTFLKPGDLLVYSNPLYGGTNGFIKRVLPTLGVNILGFDPTHTQQEVEELIAQSGFAGQLKMIYVETPANPTNELIDLEMCVSISNVFRQKGQSVIVAVDNTYMGPLWQHPIKHGVDLVLYSATKYIGGHSDVIAGACLGASSLISQVKGMRTFFGNTASPNTCWLMLRSLETLQIRMERQAENAAFIYKKINNHPKIAAISYLGDIQPDTKAHEIYLKQYASPGAMLSIFLNGGEKEAFAFLNQLQLIKLAVSLGSTESLAQHPATMTHAGVDPMDKSRYGIKENLIRLSVGIENAADLVADIEQALTAI